MAFKMKPAPFKMDETPVYYVDMEEGVLGKANNNGSAKIMYPGYDYTFPGAKYVTEYPLNKK